MEIIPRWRKTPHGERNLPSNLAPAASTALTISIHVVNFAEPIGRRPLRYVMHSCGTAATVIQRHQQLQGNRMGWRAYLYMEKPLRRDFTAKHHDGQKCKAAGLVRIFSSGLAAWIKTWHVDKESEVCRCLLDACISAGADMSGKNTFGIVLPISVYLQPACKGSLIRTCLLGASTSEELHQLADMLAAS